MKPIGRPSLEQFCGWWVTTCYHSHQTLGYFLILLINRRCQHRSLIDPKANRFDLLSRTIDEKKCTMETGVGFVSWADSPLEISHCIVHSSFLDVCCAYPTNAPTYTGCLEASTATRHCQLRTCARTLSSRQDRPIT